MALSYQASTTSGGASRASARCSAEGTGSGANAPFIRSTRVLRCLKFSMNCADWVRRVRILCGTDTFAVSRAASASGVLGTEYSGTSSSTRGPRYGTRRPSRSASTRKGGRIMLQSSQI